MAAAHPRSVLAVRSRSAEMAALAIRTSGIDGSVRLSRTKVPGGRSPWELGVGRWELIHPMSGGRDGTSSVGS
jgi:hypothetical protein